MPSPPHVLVIRRRYLGDIVVLGCFIRNIRLHWPDAKITALTQEPYGDILSINPDVSEIFRLPRVNAPSKWLALLGKLRSGTFTHVFDLDNTEKTALLTRFTGAAFRAGLRYEGNRLKFGSVYTHAVYDTPAVHESHSMNEYFLRLLSAAEIPIQTLEVRLTPRVRDIENLKQFTAGQLLIHPGSRSLHRVWPAERFANVANRIQKELGARVTLVGGPGEKNIVDAILSRADPGIERFEQPLTITEFAALAACHRVMICHDSGPMHVATAVGTPVVALFGSQNAEVWKPTGAKNILLQAPLPCEQCVAPNECVRSDSYQNYCVRRISEDQVFQAAKTILDRTD